MIAEILRAMRASCNPAFIQRSAEQLAIALRGRDFDRARGLTGPNRNAWWGQ